MATHQETQGLLSPFLRRQRHAQIVRGIREGDVVVDIACGSGLLARALPRGVSYYGVDRLAPPAGGFPGPGTFLQADLLDPRAFEHLRERLAQSPTVVVMAAFLEHLRDPSDLVAKAASLLGAGGRIVGTTPMPKGRRLHDTLAWMGICSRDGAEEHEAFLNRADLGAVATRTGLRLTAYRTFLFGLNQYFELAKGP
jgi:2-polyprenyl-3-methyl-5-hydroxy-6-metoxy-1,4-benzoquinol methylase